MSRLPLRSWLAIAFGLFAVLTGLVFLAVEPALATIIPHDENHASGSATIVENLIEHNTRLSGEGAWEIPALAYDLASDDAVAVRAGGGLADDAARAVPMGSSRSPMKIPGQQNVPTTIGGRQYTGPRSRFDAESWDHALCR